ncbi:MAG: DinB family protein [Candidatus Kapaibacterium sp.]
MTSNPPTSKPTILRIEENLEALGKNFHVFLNAATHYPRDLIRVKPTEIAFSATEVVYHMLDVERLWQRRIRGLLDGTMTKFQQMDPDKEARDQRYNEKPYEDGISELKRAREETHSLVRGMKSDELLLAGIHSRYGEMNTFDILAKMKEHDRTHATQLERTLAQISQTNIRAIPAL